MPSTKPGHTPEGQITTRDRLLDAAERLFAERGISSTSMRRITAEAGANLAAVNYHFGSKESLVEAVYTRRIEPVNRERIRRLEACEAEAGGAPSVEKILESFLAPPFHLHREPGGAGQFLVRLLSRAHAEQSNDLRRMVFALFETTFRRFSEALARALPRLPAEEVAFRMKCMVGAMAFAMTDLAFGKHHPLGSASADVDTSIDGLVRFLAAGFRTPSRGEDR